MSLSFILSFSPLIIYNDRSEWANKNAKTLDGREMPLIKIRSETLKYRADKAEEKLKDQLEEEIVKKEKTRRILEISALWSEKMEMSMRNSAVEARIAKSWNSEKL